jgi:tetratricopeptide (TPR) repeat protein
MPKTGRNDPCPCGSGNKYKRCCLDKDQAAEHATLAAAQAERATRCQQRGARIRDLVASIEQADELTAASNAVIDLIQAGKLDEAERAARDLLVRYPEVHDGYDRLGMVYEARSQPREAAQCYRQVIEFVRAHPEDYEPEFEATFHEIIARLDPPAAAR